jgi:hypothetical protein
MTDQERIQKLEQEVAELKDIISSQDSRMRQIFQEEFQKEIFHASAPQSQ